MYNSCYWPTLVSTFYIDYLPLLRWKTCSFTIKLHAEWKSITFSFASCLKCLKYVLLIRKKHFSRQKMWMKMTLQVGTNICVINCSEKEVNTARTMCVSPRLRHCDRFQKTSIWANIKIKYSCEGNVGSDLDYSSISNQYKRNTNYSLQHGAIEKTSFSAP